MKSDTIDTILQGIPGSRRDGAAILFAEDCELSLYVVLASEVLTLPRVSRYERTGDLSVIESHTGDRHYVPTEAISLVKVTGINRRAPGRSAGFR